MAIYRYKPGDTELSSIHPDELTSPDQLGRGDMFALNQPGGLPIRGGAMLEAPHVLPIEVNTQGVAGAGMALDAREWIDEWFPRYQQDKKALRERVQASEPGDPYYLSTVHDRPVHTFQIATQASIGQDLDAETVTHQLDAMFARIDEMSAERQQRGITNPFTVALPVFESQRTQQTALRAYRERLAAYTDRDDINFVMFGPQSGAFRSEHEITQRQMRAKVKDATPLPALTPFYAKHQTRTPEGKRAGVSYEGRVYPTVAHAFVASMYRDSDTMKDELAKSDGKYADPVHGLRQAYAGITPSPEWVREAPMILKDIVVTAAKENPEFERQLRTTQRAPIIDTRLSDVGQLSNQKRLAGSMAKNIYGQALMAAREEIQTGQAPEIPRPVGYRMAERSIATDVFQSDQPLQRGTEMRIRSIHDVPRRMETPPAHRFAPLPQAIMDIPDPSRITRPLTEAQQAAIDDRLRRFDASLQGSRQERRDREQAAATQPKAKPLPEYTTTTQRFMRESDRISAAARDSNRSRRERRRALGYLFEAGKIPEMVPTQHPLDPRVPARGFTMSSGERPLVKAMRMRVPRLSSDPAVMQDWRERSAQAFDAAIGRVAASARQAEQRDDPVPSMKDAKLRSMIGFGFSHSPVFRAPELQRLFGTPEPPLTSGASFRPTEFDPMSRIGHAQSAETFQQLQDDLRIPKHSGTGRSLSDLHHQVRSIGITPHADQIQYLQPFLQELATSHTETVVASTGNTTGMPQLIRQASAFVQDFTGVAPLFGEQYEGRIAHVAEQYQDDPVGLVAQIFQYEDQLEDQRMSMFDEDVRRAFRRGSREDGSFAYDRDRLGSLVDFGSPEKQATALQRMAEHAAHIDTELPAELREFVARVGAARSYDFQGSDVFFGSPLAESASDIQESLGDSDPVVGATQARMMAQQQLDEGDQGEVAFGEGMHVGSMRGSGRVFGAELRQASSLSALGRAAQELRRGKIPVLGERTGVTRTFDPVTGYQTMTDAALRRSGLHGQARFSPTILNDMQMGRGLYSYLAMGTDASTGTDRVVRDASLDITAVTDRDIRRMVRQANPDSALSSYDLEKTRRVLQAGRRDSAEILRTATAEHMAGYSADWDELPYEQHLDTEFERRFAKNRHDVGSLGAADALTALAASKVGLGPHAVESEGFSGFGSAALRDVFEHVLRDTTSQETPFTVVRALMDTAQELDAERPAHMQRPGFPAVMRRAIAEGRIDANTKIPRTVLSALMDTSRELDAEKAAHMQGTWFSVMMQQAIADGRIDANMNASSTIFRALVDAAQELDAERTEHDDRSAHRQGTGYTAVMQRALAEGRVDRATDPGQRITEARRQYLDPHIATPGVGTAIEHALWYSLVDQDTSGEPASFEAFEEHATNMLKAQYPEGFDQMLQDMTAAHAVEEDHPRRSLDNPGDLGLLALPGVTTDHTGILAAIAQESRGHGLGSISSILDVTGSRLNTFAYQDRAGAAPDELRRMLFTRAHTLAGISGITAAPGIPGNSFASADIFGAAVHSYRFAQTLAGMMSPAKISDDPDSEQAHVPKTDSFGSDFATGHPDPLDPYQRVSMAEAQERYTRLAQDLVVKGSKSSPLAKEQKTLAQTLADQTPRHRRSFGGFGLSLEAVEPSGGVFGAFPGDVARSKPRVPKGKIGQYFRNEQQLREMRERESFLREYVGADGQRGLAHAQALDYTKRAQRIKDVRSFFSETNETDMAQFAVWMEGALGFMVPQGIEGPRYADKNEVRTAFADRFAGADVDTAAQMAHTLMGQYQEFVAPLREGGEPAYTHEHLAQVAQAIGAGDRAQRLIQARFGLLDQDQLSSQEQDDLGTLQNQVPTHFLLSGRPGESGSGLERSRGSTPQFDQRIVDSTMQALAMRDVAPVSRVQFPQKASRQEAYDIYKNIFSTPGNEEQQRIFDAPNKGLMTISAHAGTGKTTLATGKMTQDEFKNATVLSFQTTSRDEVRERIANQFSSHAAGGFDIRTLDSDTLQVANAVLRHQRDLLDSRVFSSGGLRIPHDRTSFSPLDSESRDSVLDVMNAVNTGTPRFMGLSIRDVFDSGRGDLTDVQKRSLHTGVTRLTNRGGLGDTSQRAIEGMVRKYQREVGATQFGRDDIDPFIQWARETHGSGIQREDIAAAMVMPQVHQRYLDTGTADFSFITGLATEALRDTTIRSQYQTDYGILDEIQDSSALQLEYASLRFGQGLLAIGDPGQNVAASMRDTTKSPFAYLSDSWKKTHTGDSATTQAYSLTQSRRQSGLLNAFSSALLARDTQATPGWTGGTISYQGYRDLPNQASLAQTEIAGQTRLFRDMIMAYDRENPEQSFLEAFDTGFLTATRNKTAQDTPRMILSALMDTARELDADVHERDDLPAHMQGRSYATLMQRAIAEGRIDANTIHSGKGRTYDVAFGLMTGVGEGNLQRHVGKDSSGRQRVPDPSMLADLFNAETVSREREVMADLYKQGFRASDIQQASLAYVVSSRARVATHLSGQGAISPLMQAGIEAARQYAGDDVSMDRPRSIQDAVRPKGGERMPMDPQFLSVMQQAALETAAVMQIPELAQQDVTRVLPPEFESGLAETLARSAQMSEQSRQVVHDPANFGSPEKPARFAAYAPELTQILQDYGRVQADAPDVGDEKGQKYSRIQMTVESFLKTVTGDKTMTTRALGESGMGADVIGLDPEGNPVTADYGKRYQVDLNDPAYGIDRMPTPVVLEMGAKGLQFQAQHAADLPEEVFQAEGFASKAEGLPHILDFWSQRYGAGAQGHNLDITALPSPSASDRDIADAFLPGDAVSSFSQQKYRDFIQSGGNPAPATFSLNAYDTFGAPDSLRDLALRAVRETRPEAVPDIREHIAYASAPAGLQRQDVDVNRLISGAIDDPRNPWAYAQQRRLDDRRRYREGTFVRPDDFGSVLATRTPDADQASVVSLFDHLPQEMQDALRMSDEDLVAARAAAQKPAEVAQIRKQERIRSILQPPDPALSNAQKQQKITDTAAMFAVTNYQGGVTSLFEQVGRLAGQGRPVQIDTRLPTDSVTESGSRGSAATHVMQAMVDRMFGAQPGSVFERSAVAAQLPQQILAAQPKAPGMPTLGAQLPDVGSRIDQLQTLPEMARATYAQAYQPTFDDNDYVVAATGPRPQHMSVEDERSAYVGMVRFIEQRKREADEAGKRMVMRVGGARGLDLLAGDVAMQMGVGLEVMLPTNARDHAEYAGFSAEDAVRLDRQLEYAHTSGGGVYTSTPAYPRDFQGALDMPRERFAQVAQARNMALLANRGREANEVVSFYDAEKRPRGGTANMLRSAQAFGVPISNLHPDQGLPLAPDDPDQFLDRMIRKPLLAAGHTTRIDVQGDSMAARRGLLGGPRSTRTWKDVVQRLGETTDQAVRSGTAYEYRPQHIPDTGVNIHAIHGPFESANQEEMARALVAHGIGSGAALEHGTRFVDQKEAQAFAKNQLGQDSAAFGWAMRDQDGGHQIAVQNLFHQGRAGIAQMAHTAAHEYGHVFADRLRQTDAGRAGLDQLQAFLKSPGGPSVGETKDQRQARIAAKKRAKRDRALLADRYGGSYAKNEVFEEALADVYAEMRGMRNIARDRDQGQFSFREQMPEFFQQAQNLFTQHGAGEDLGYLFQSPDEVVRSLWTQQRDATMFTRQAVSGVHIGSSYDEFEPTFHDDMGPPAGFDDMGPPVGFDDMGPPPDFYDDMPPEFNDDMDLPSDLPEPPPALPVDVGHGSLPDHVPADLRAHMHPGGIDDVQQKSIRDLLVRSGGPVPGETSEERRARIAANKQTKLDRAALREHYGGSYRRNDVFQAIVADLDAEIRGDARHGAFAFREKTPGFFQQARNIVLSQRADGPMPPAPPVMATSEPPAPPVMATPEPPAPPSALNFGTPEIQRRRFDLQQGPPSPAALIPPRGEDVARSRQARSMQATYQHLVGTANPRQRAAIESDAAWKAIAADAGTGKTNVLTTMAAKELARGTAPSTMHIFGFARKSAAEIGERASGQLGSEYVGGRAGMQIRTFDSFNQQILRHEHGRQDLLQQHFGQFGVAYGIDPRAHGLPMLSSETPSREAAVGRDRRIDDRTRYMMETLNQVRSGERSLFGGDPVQTSTFLSQFEEHITRRSGDHRDERMARRAVRAADEIMATHDQFGFERLAGLSTDDRREMGLMNQGLTELASVYHQNMLENQQFSVPADDTTLRQIGGLGFGEIDLLAQRQLEQEQMAVQRGDADPSSLRSLRDSMQWVAVDEAQDMTARQAAKLQMIAPQSLVAVGDMKQSIYGFNQAVGTFADEIGIPDPGRFSLTDNYRSGSAVIDAVNRVFGTRTAAQAPNTGAVQVTHHTEEDIRAAGFRLDPQWQRRGLTEQQGFALHQAANRAEELIAGGAKPEDIAIASRFNKQNAFLESEFERRGIAVKQRRSVADLEQAEIQKLAQERIHTEDESGYAAFAQQFAEGDLDAVDRFNTHVQQIERELRGAEPEHEPVQQLMKGRVDAAVAAQESAPGIVLDTIHRTKGGAWPHVILPDVGGEGSVVRSQTLHGDPVKGIPGVGSMSPDDLHQLMIRPEDQLPAHLQGVPSESKEELRLLYTGMTRPRETLDMIQVGAENPLFDSLTAVGSPSAPPASLLREALPDSAATPGIATGMFARSDVQRRPHGAAPSLPDVHMPSAVAGGVGLALPGNVSVDMPVVGGALAQYAEGMRRQMQAAALPMDAPTAPLVVPGAEGGGPGVGALDLPSMPGNVADLQLPGGLRGTALTLPSDVGSPADLVSAAGVSFAGGPGIGALDIVPDMSAAHELAQREIQREQDAMVGVVGSFTGSPDGSSAGSPDGSPADVARASGRVQGSTAQDPLHVEVTEKSAKSIATQTAEAQRTAGGMPSTARAVPAPPVVGMPRELQERMALSGGVQPSGLSRDLQSVVASIPGPLAPMPPAGTGAAPPPPPPPAARSQAPRTGDTIPLFGGAQGVGGGQVSSYALDTEAQSQSWMGRAAHAVSSSRLGHYVGGRVASTMGDIESLRRFAGSPMMQSMGHLTQAGEIIGNRYMTRFQQILQTGTEHQGMRATAMRKLGFLHHDAGVLHGERAIWDAESQSWETVPLDPEHRLASVLQGTEADVFTGSTAKLRALPYIDMSFTKHGELEDPDAVRERIKTVTRFGYLADMEPEESGMYTRMASYATGAGSGQAVSQEDVAQHVVGYSEQSGMLMSERELLDSASRITRVLPQTGEAGFGQALALADIFNRQGLDGGGAVAGIQQSLLTPDVQRSIQLKAMHDAQGRDTPFTSEAYWGFQSDLVSMRQQVETQPLTREAMRIEHGAVAGGVGASTARLDYEQQGRNLAFQRENLQIERSVLERQEKLTTQQFEMQQQQFQVQGVNLAHQQRVLGISEQQFGLEQRQNQVSLQQGALDLDLMQTRRQYAPEQSQLQLQQSTLQFALDDKLLDIRKRQLPLQRRQAQVSLEAQQTQLGMAQEDLAFRKWYDTQMYGSPGADRSQRAGFALSEMQLQQGRDVFGQAEHTQQAQQKIAQTPVRGLAHEKFYAGIEHQMSQLHLGRNEFRSEAAYAENIKYLQKQTELYEREADLEAIAREHSYSQAEKSISIQEKQFEVQKELIALQIEEAAARERYEGAMIPLQKRLLEINHAIEQKQIAQMPERLRLEEESLQITQEGVPLTEESRRLGLENQRFNLEAQGEILERQKQIAADQYSIQQEQFARQRKQLDLEESRLRVDEELYRRQGDLLVIQEERAAIEARVADEMAGILANMLASKEALGRGELGTNAGQAEDLLKTAEHYSQFIGTDQELQYRITDPAMMALADSYQSGELQKQLDIAADVQQETNEDRDFVGESAELVQATGGAELYRWMNELNKNMVEAFNEMRKPDEDGNTEIDLAISMEDFKGDIEAASTELQVFAGVLGDGIGPLTDMVNIIAAIGGGGTLMTSTSVAARAVAHNQGASAAGNAAMLGASAGTASKAVTFGGLAAKFMPASLIATGALYGIDKGTEAITGGEGIWGDQQRRGRDRLLRGQVGAGELAEAGLGTMATFFSVPAGVAAGATNMLMGGTFKEGYEQVGGDVQNAVMERVPRGLERVGEAAVWLAGKIDEGAALLWDALTWVADQLMSIPSSAETLVVGAFDSGVQVLSEGFQWIRDGIAEGGQFVLDSLLAVRDKAHEGAQWIADVFAQGGQLVRDSAQFVWETFTEISTLLWEGAQFVWEKFTEISTLLWEGAQFVWEKFTEISTLLWEGAQFVWEKFTEIGDLFWEAAQVVNEKFTEIGTLLWEAATLVGERFADIRDLLWEGAEVVWDGFDEMSSTFSEHWDTLIAGLRVAGDAVLGWAQDLMNQAQDIGLAVSEGLDRLKFWEDKQKEQAPPPKEGAGEDVPGYAIGIRYVPENMLAQLHAGELVLNPSEAQAFRENAREITGPESVRALTDYRESLKDAASRADQHMSVGASQQSTRLSDAAASAGPTQAHQRSITYGDVTISVTQNIQGTMDRTLLDQLKQQTLDAVADAIQQLAEE